MLRRRGADERLGMELNAYNQILSIAQGSPSDRAPDVEVHDRVLAVDGTELGDRLLSDVMRAQLEHTLLLERAVYPDKKGGGAMGSPRISRLLTPRRLLAGSDDNAPMSPSKTPSKKARGGKRPPLPPVPPNSTAAKFDRFRVVIRRGPTGLGLVCDADSTIVDMVPGSAADVKRLHATHEYPQMQIGDRIVCVDGEALDGRAIDDLLTPADEHAFLCERPKGATAPSPPRSLSSRVARALTPRGSTDAGHGLVEQAPSRALREVRLYKADDAQRLGIRFIRDDDGFDQEWVCEDTVQPIVAALDPSGEAAAAGLEVDDMVLSINGQTGLSNTQAAAQLRELVGEICLVVRRAAWVAGEDGGVAAPETPRSALRRLV